MFLHCKQIRTECTNAYTCSMKHMQLILYTISASVIIVISALIGAVAAITVQSKRPSNSVAILHTKPVLVPTVQINGIRNKQVYGSIQGNVQLLIGNTIVQSSSGVFNWPAGPLLNHEITITVPQGMQYVVSKKGKKVYSVSAKNVRTIAPENRRYFSTLEQAIKAGYAY
jgi:hypothetical protein